MRSLLTILVAATLASGAAFGQVYGTTTTVTTTTTASAMDLPVSAVPCPTTAVNLPGPCAAVAANTVADSTVILVLGSEENYALSNLPVKHVGWRDAPTNYASIFAEGNPITFHQPNNMVTRHGNPYYPYYRINEDINMAAVAGRTERYVRIPNTLSTDTQNSLRMVSERYRSLTPQQAAALGYMPLSTCINGMGTVYVNRSLIDNRYDPMQPEAFSFGPDGRLLAVHYIAQTTQPFVAFQQTTTASAVVPGAQQLSVWLFEPNPNGLFAPVGTSTYCPTM